LDPFVPTNPNGPWQRKVFFPKILEAVRINIKFISIEATKFGERMFKADYLMKQQALALKEQYYS